MDEAQQVVGGVTTQVLANPSSSNICLLKKSIMNFDVTTTVNTALNVISSGSRIVYVS